MKCESCFVAICLLKVDLQVANISIQSSEHRSFTNRVNTLVYAGCEVFLVWLPRLVCGSGRKSVTVLLSLVQTWSTQLLLIEVVWCIRTKTLCSLYFFRFSNLTLRPAVCRVYWLGTLNSKLTTILYGIHLYKVAIPHKLKRAENAKILVTLCCVLTQQLDCALPVELRVLIILFFYMLVT